MFCLLCFEGNSLVGFFTIFFSSFPSYDYDTRLFSLLSDICFVFVTLAVRMILWGGGGGHLDSLA
ncbi:hypothetical protein QBC44DRAFT_325854 [Cladorrhinum sp. PSN332]|nr:hypothetical protein QBC44DRAFT_325854 [Cladorrhinum sp. PSN332]